MDDTELFLKTFRAGRVLDIATGSGNFINFLLEKIKDYEEIIAIDTSEQASSTFSEIFKDKSNIRFIKMDARHMDFPDASFDTVCISNSLHHLPDPKAVLADMKRVLRSGGYFIVAEMYRDNQTETQLTHVLLHHWRAAVDMAVNTFHNETYTRQQILEFIGGLGLKGLMLEDASYLNDDPRNPVTIKNLTEIVDQCQKRIVGLPGEVALRERGLELYQRIAEIGFHNATSLLVIGVKP